MIKKADQVVLDAAVTQIVESPPSDWSEMVVYLLLRLSRKVGRYTWGRVVEQIEKGMGWACPK